MPTKAKVIVSIDKKYVWYAAVYNWRDPPSRDKKSKFAVPAEADDLIYNNPKVCLKDCCCDDSTKVAGAVATCHWNTLVVV